MDGIPVTDETLDVNAILSAGPGGDYMGHELTMKLLRGYHSTSTLFNRQNRSGWQMTSGGKDSREMAKAEAQRILSEHRPSVELSDDVKAEFKRIIADAEAEVRENPEVLE